MRMAANAMAREDSVYRAFVLFIAVYPMISDAKLA